jgi:hypothetical protein
MMDLRPLRMRVAHGQRPFSPEYRSCSYLVALRPEIRRVRLSRSVFAEIVSGLRLIPFGLDNRLRDILRFVTRRGDGGEQGVLDVGERGATPKPITSVGEMQARLARGVSCDTVDPLRPAARSTSPLGEELPSHCSPKGGDAGEAS